MLYSEIKERGNRFKTALKIGFPFFIFVVIYILLVNLYHLKDKEIVLLVILSISYIYYIFYLIYSGFKTTLVDNVTKTFNRTYIVNLVDKWTKKHKNGNVIMLKLANIYDINDRYGMVFGDKILKELANQLNIFLIKKGYDKIPIGRYGGGYFILLIDEQESVLRQIFNNFQSKQRNRGINGVELKIEVAMTTRKSNDNKDNIINYLLYQFEYDDTSEMLKPDVYDKLICKSIDNEEFIFSYQPIIDLNTKKVSIYEILIKLHVEEFGTFTNIQLRSVVNRNGYERIFDEKMISALLKYLAKIKLDVLICLHVSPVVLRNSKFRSFIKQKIVASELNPKNFIFAFTEKKSYDEIKRFEEIMQEYKKMGFKFLLNQFGGNNASLEYLKWLPIDYASFDLEYTKYLKKPKYHEILNSYIQLLKSLGIVSVVKFVETPYVYESLKKLGVDMLQGYMIGKPKNIEMRNDNVIID